MDRQLTQKVLQAAQLFDVKVLDHIILAPDGRYYSFMDNGLVKKTYFKWMARCPKGSIGTKTAQSLWLGFVVFNRLIFIYLTYCCTAINWCGDSIWLSLGPYHSIWLLFRYHATGFWTMLCDAILGRCAKRISIMRTSKKWKTSKRKKQDH